MIIISESCVNQLDEVKIKIVRHIHFDFCTPPLHIVAQSDRHFLSSGYANEIYRVAQKK